MENNKLQTSFNTKSLLKYAFPTIFMIIFMSTYSIVDGVFVSNFVNESALSAINIAYPAITVVFALGFMLVTGSNAIIGKLMGERKDYEAKQFFTLIYIVGTLLGIILMGIIIIFINPILVFLNAQGSLYSYAKDYLFIYSLFMPMAVLQIYTQSFFVTAGKPGLGFFTCFLGGIANIILDYVFIVMLGLGIKGAALATGIGCTIPALYGILYFAFNKKSPLKFVKPKWSGRLLLQSITNGMSEFVTSIAMSVTTLLFNVILMQIAGESGIAAITVILYVQMMQTAIYAGYSFGISPIISYKFGEQNHAQLKQIMKTSFYFLIISSLITLVLSLIFAEIAVGIFIPKSSATFNLAVNGFRIFSLAYIFAGFNIFASSLFTALSNGKISAFLSFNRTLIFIVICLLTLPYILGINGVWLAVPIAEALSFILAAWQYFKNKRIYNY